MPSFGVGKQQGCGARVESRETSNERLDEVVQVVQVVQVVEVAVGVAVEVAVWITVEVGALF